MPCRLKFYSTPRDFPPSRLDAQFCLIKLLKYRVARLKIGRYVGQSLVLSVREGGSDFIKADRKFCIALDAGPSAVRPAARPLVNPFDPAFNRVRRPRPRAAGGADPAAGVGRYIKQVPFAWM